MLMPWVWRPRQAEADEEQAETNSTKKEKPKAKLLPSDIINALDGVSTHRGRVLVMTTNHIEHLDLAPI